jgi:hypothetical protein
MHREVKPHKANQDKERFALLSDCPISQWTREARLRSSGWQGGKTSRGRLLLGMARTGKTAPIVRRDYAGEAMAQREKRSGAKRKESRRVHSAGCRIEERTALYCFSFCRASRFM